MAARRRDALSSHQSLRLIFQGIEFCNCGRASNIQALQQGVKVLAIVSTFFAAIHPQLYVIHHLLNPDAEIREMWIPAPLASFMMSRANLTRKLMGRPAFLPYKILQ